MPFRRVLLIKPGGRRGLGFALDVIPIGIEYIAAVIENDVEDVNIIDMELEQQPLEFFIDSFRPDLVGITMAATDYNEGLRLAKIAKEKGCTTVLGGYHPTFTPDDILSNSWVDLVIRGEGEFTMKDLVQMSTPKDVLGLSYKQDGKIVHNAERPLIQDLDALPFPARHLRRHKYTEFVKIDKKWERDMISMSRGCWGRCSFCCEPSMSGGLQRFRSPENVMKELLEISSFHNGRPLYILVTDPSFMGSTIRIEELCNLLSKHKLEIRFSVLARADSIAKNPELVKKMCENGILNYEVGVESPRAEDLNNIQKDTTLETQKRAVEILRRNGAYAGGTLVIGLPNQTEEEIMRYPLYAKEIGLNGAAFGVATPFPGTEFYNDLKKDDLIIDHDWDHYDEMHSVFKLKNMSGQKLEELATYCHGKFWTLEKLIEHVKISRNLEGKIAFEEFVRCMLDMLKFAWSTTSDLQEKNILTHLRIAFEASADPSVEEYTKKVGLHNIIEFSGLLLKVMGPQTIQFTITDEGTPITSYILKTTGKTIDYVKAIQGKQEDATINFNVGLKSLSFSGDKNTMKLMKDFFKAAISLQAINETWNRLRLLAGLGLGSIQLMISHKINALRKTKNQAANN